MTGEQAALAKQMADQEFAEQAREVEDARAAALTKRERRRECARAETAATHEATLTEIGRQFEEAQKALDADTDAKIAETKRQLAEARQALDAALAEAKRKRTEAETEKAPPGKPKLPGNLKEQLEGVADVLARKISVTGTFNPAAVRGLGGGDAVERTATATALTAKHTKRLVDAAITGGRVFA
ncbi:MAG: hypothetical protein GY842_18565 [bacterium]|nr:hypothetical protein [bacterium]